MATKTKYKWVIEITVDPVLVADGFELTNNNIQDMVHQMVPHAYGFEFKAKVISAPDRKRIRKEQGYDS